MTEETWLACTDPGSMMGFLQVCGKTSARQCRLFACACVRRVWPLLPDAACGRAVEAAERFADRKADIEELAAALVGMEFSRKLRRAAVAARTACWEAAFDGRAASRLASHFGVLASFGAYSWGETSRAAGDARQAVVWQVASEAKRARRKARKDMRAAKDHENRAQADLLRGMETNRMTASSHRLHPFPIPCTWILLCSHG